MSKLILKKFEQTNSKEVDEFIYLYKYSLYAYINN